MRSRCTSEIAQFTLMQYGEWLTPLVSATWVATAPAIAALNIIISATFVDTVLAGKANVHNLVCVRVGGWMAFLSLVFVIHFGSL
ncbi:hypothetical protein L208DRAFT_1409858 [Tricholoma matsutake]|nr:hypothetical protein L208DRAFT_1409858 [Tricholoma matsutake 945]